MYLVKLIASLALLTFAGCTSGSQNAGQDRTVKVLVLANGNGSVTSAGREPLDCRRDGTEQACNWSFEGAPELTATPDAEWRFVQWKATDVEIVANKVQGRAGVPLDHDTDPHLTGLDGSCRKRDAASPCNNYIINAIFQPIADGGVTADGGI